MSLKSHPLHLMVVHFSVALYPASLVCDVIGLYYTDLNFAFASFYALSGALIMAIPAIGSGIYDLYRWKTGKEERARVIEKALYHGGIQLFVSLGFLILWIRQLKTFPIVDDQGLTTIIVKSVLVLLMLGANYIGGDLVINHLHKKTGP